MNKAIWATGELSDEGLNRDFEKLEKFDTKFRTILNDWHTWKYKWPVDPLHHWSRFWEYPFVANQLIHAGGSNGRVLDVGSATTFFPFYVSELLGCEVIALDPDPEHCFHFLRASKAASQKLGFKKTPTPLEAYGDETGQAEDSFDTVYSVSVIEHIPNPLPVVNEVFRVLKPGGTLILTLDVCFECSRDSDGLNEKDLHEFIEAISSHSSDPIIVPNRPANLLTTNTTPKYSPSELKPLSSRLRPIEQLPFKLLRRIPYAKRRRENTSPKNSNLCALGIVAKKR